MGPAALWTLLLLVAQSGGAPPVGDDLARALEVLGVEDTAALDAALGQEPHEDLAQALRQVALALDERGERERGIALRRDALRMRLELSGAAGHGTLVLVQELLESYLTLGRYGEGAALARARVLDLELPEGESAVFLANLLNLCAAALQSTGEYGAAETCTRRALERMLEGAEPGHWLTTRLMSNLAALLGDLGRLREGRELALEALELRLEHEGARSEPVARSYMVLARLQQSEGEFAGAEADLRHAERLLRAQERVRPIYLSECLRMLGGLALARGDAAAAEACYREARALIVEVMGPQHPDVVACDIGAGFALHAAGRAEQALPIFEAVGDLREAMFGAAFDLTVQARISQALALESIGDPAAAVALMRAQLERLAAATGHQAELEASLRSNLARCLMTLGELDAAERELELTIGDLEQRYGAQSVFLADPFVRRALLAEARGDLADAEDFARRAMAIAADQRDRVLGADVERSRLSAQLGYADMGRLVARLCLLREDVVGALAALEETRARTLLDGLLRAERSAARDGDSDSTLERLLTAEEDARAALRELEARAALLGEGEGPEVEDLVRGAAAARNALGAATAALAVHARESTRAARPPGVDAIAACLREGEVLVSMLWTPSHAGWVELRKGRQGAELRHVALAQGEDRVEALARPLNELARALARDPRARAGALPEVPPALAQAARASGLGGAERVFVVPDGPLLSLPCELVFGDALRQPLLLPSASTLAVLRSRAPSERPASRAVVLGDPAFGGGAPARERADGGLASLPAARAEANYVAALLEAAGRDVRLLTGEEATRDALEEACQAAGLLHLATHGFSGTSAAPFDAALALAAGPDGAGDLTLDRLIRRWAGRLESCELVVLSACETHREVDVGTGSFSLALGFFHAGAGDVLASLWKVDERATALLMGRFFENLLGLRGELADDGSLTARPTEPMDRAAALGEAREWIRAASRDEVRAASRRMGLGRSAGGTRSGEPSAVSGTSTSDLRPYADPYFWAGFVLLGR